MMEPNQSNPGQADQAEAAGVPATARPRAGALTGMLGHSRFLIAAGLLLICAVGFNAAAQALKLHFRKLPMQLRVAALDDKSTGLPAVLGGRWVQINEDRPMSPDMEKELGTKQYLNRVYIDSSAAHRTVEELQGMPLEKQLLLQRELMSRSPEAIIHLHIPYYTGLVDTVAHIPDRCMVADGFRDTGHELKSGPDQYSDDKKRVISYRFMRFEDTTSQARVTNNVAYFFRVNGAYTDDPLQVRYRLQNLFETYGYYAKIELKMEEPNKSDDAARGRIAAAMNDFLSVLVPEFERCLPDWNAVTGQSVPELMAPATPAKP